MPALWPFLLLSIVEFLSFPHLIEKDKNIFKEIVAEGSVISLDYENAELINAIVDIRKTYRLKLPDAILAATALTYDCQLVSNDKELQKVPGLSIIRFTL